MIQERSYGLGVDETPAKIYICHVDHEHDRIYAENVVEYLVSKGVLTKVIHLASDSNRRELEECLDDAEAPVLGFNAHLDHSWVASERFLELAERPGLPVL